MNHNRFKYRCECGDEDCRRSKSMTPTEYARLTRNSEPLILSGCKAQARKQRENSRRFGALLREEW